MKICRVGEVAGLGEAATHLPQGEAHLVHEDDAVRLRALATGEEEAGGTDAGENWPLASGSPSSMAETLRAASAASSERAVRWAAGACESGRGACGRPPARASSGFVPPRVGAQLPLVRAPAAVALEDPSSERSSSSAPATAPAGRSRSSRPGTPASKAAVSAGEAATWRPISHSASDGAAESTPPIPATSVMVRPGSPIAWQTPATVPVPTPAAAEMAMCRQNSRR
jgi:hypothetical protein